MHEAFNASTWLLDRHVEAGNGDRLAIRCQGRGYSYAETHQLVQEAAGSLRRLGVGPEDRVAMALLDSVEFVTIFLGAMRIGAIPVPMNPLLPGRDLAVIANEARARTVAVSAEVADRVDELRAGAPELRDVIVTGPDLTEGCTQAWPSFVEDPHDASPYPTWTESPGFWLCTSGSTGQPKLAMHRHADIRVTCETYAADVIAISPEDRCFSVGPMFHAYGLGNSLTFPFSVGATSVLEPTRPPTPQLVADVMAAEQPTLFFCIPTFYAALNAAPLADDTFASVRHGISAAEPLPAETFTRFQERYGVTVLDGIGSTEQLHIYLSNTPGRVKAGTSGVPVPGYDVRVIDNEGRDQPDGEAGELIVSGQSAATGYWCRAEQSRATFEGRWMRTGDLYVRHADGFHTYLGRVDDMLRVGGEWVSPAEVEAALIEHDAVLEAAVVSERDDGGVVRPIAFVIASPGESPRADDLDAWCRTRLAGYKRPRRFEMVEQLPKTATGKIQRYKLRARPLAGPAASGTNPEEH